MKNNFLLQATKYGIVGLINSLLTATTIWVMMYVVFNAENKDNVSPLVISFSNTMGFTIGLINSFIWNRKWTFKSKNHWRSDFIRFVTAFLVCYIPQLLFVNFLNIYTDLRFEAGHLVVSHAFACQLAGIVFYTSINFLINKHFTFRQVKNL